MICYVFGNFQVCKAFFGRLRPHFLSVCGPDWTKFSCRNEEFIDGMVFPITKTVLLFREASLYHNYFDVAVCIYAFVKVICLHYVITI